jgi:HEAT repeat protein
MGDKRAVHPLVEALTDWEVRHSAAMALDSLGWKPVIPSNRIHYLYAKGQKDELLNEWELTNKILLNDIRSGTQKSIQNAVYAFIDLKGDYIIPQLIKILDSSGNPFIAQVYLGSRHQRLMEAATRWADRHGFHTLSETDNNASLKGQ